jgi:hypothetical protein
MRPKVEMFCPVTPFDRDVARMTTEELRAYADTVPSSDFPPVRWAGDAMDDLRGPDGAPFGPPAADDLAPFFAKGDAELPSISNRTVVDLAAVLSAFEKRCAERLGDDRRHWPALLLMRCLIKRCDVDGLAVHTALRMLTCVFVGPARFTFARFTRGIDLLGSVFADEVRFTGTTFAEKAHFHAAGFLRGAHFHETRFEGETRFNETAFNGPLSLEHTRFHETVDLARAVLAGTTWIDLSGIRIGGRTALAGDLKVRLEQIQGRILGEHGQCLSAPDRPAHSRRERQDALQYAADQYSMLAGNFAAGAGPASWRAADWCHSRYLDLWRQLARLRGHWWGWLKSGFFKVCLGNGIWLKYPLELAVAVILSFGLLYGLAFTDEIRADGKVTTAAGCAGDAEAPVRCLSDIRPGYARVVTALYYSAITFTTVGYGDWHPVGLARLFAAVEALSGITIMSAFTVILVRKIIR